MKKLLLHWEKNSFSLAEFFRNKNGLWKLERGTSYAFSAEERESHRTEKACEHLRQTLTAWKAAPTDVHCLLPAEEVFLKNVRLEIPPGLHEAIPRLAQLEAKRVFPLPLEKLTWDFQILASSSEELIEVVYAATKTEFLAPLLEIISKTNLKIKTISAVPHVLCKALQLTKQDSDACLLIDLNASCLNVILRKANTLFASYTFPLLKLEALQSAPAVLKKISADIATILEYARLQKIIPKHIFLSGGTVLKSQLLSFLQQTLEIPTSDLDQLLKNQLHPVLLESQEIVGFLNNEASFSWSLLVGSTTLFQKENLTQIFHTSHSEAMEKADKTRRRQNFDQGCMSTYRSDQNSTTTHYSSALAKLQAERDEILGLDLNLLPNSLRQEQHSQQQRPYFYGAIGLLIASLLSWTFYFHREADRFRAATIEEAQLLKQGEKKLKASEEAIADFRKIEEEKEAFENLLEARAAWPKLVQELQQALPPRYIWITKLSPISNEENCSPQKNKKMLSSAKKSSLERRS